MNVYHVSVILLVVFVGSKAQGNAEAAIGNILCSEDPTIKESVTQCVSLVPNSHLEVVKSCSDQLASIANDPVQLLDAYCNGNEMIQDAQECISEFYQSRGISPMEPVKPVIDCMKQMIMFQ